MRGFVLSPFGFETTLPALRVQSTGAKHKGDKRQVRVESSQAAFAHHLLKLSGHGPSCWHRHLWPSHMHRPDIQNTCALLLLWANKFESDLSQAFTCLLLLRADKVCPQIVNKYTAFLERLWDKAPGTHCKGDMSFTSIQRLSKENHGSGWAQGTDEQVLVSDQIRKQIYVPNKNHKAGRKQTLLSCDPPRSLKHAT